jgi:uncharacterized protein
VGYVLRNAAVAGPGFTVNGSTSAVAAEAGIPAIIAEAGGCGLVEEEAVQTHVRGLDGVLGYLEMTPPAPGPAAAPEFMAGWSWPRTPSAGWWSPAVRAGERVTAGQLLGTVEALDGGTVLETFTAPADGVVLFLTSSPAVAADGLLLGLAAAPGATA